MAEGSAAAVVTTRIIDGPLPPLDDAVVSGDGESGAELIFHGRVRATEDGRPIVALDYEAYGGMAEKELQAVAEETAAKFPLHVLHCLHRIGQVPVGDASLRVTIRAAHRAEAIQALAHFIDQLKDRVPIWKWGVTAEGERFPSHHQHGPRPPLS